MDELFLYFEFIDNQTLESEDSGHNDEVYIKTDREDR